MPKFFYFNFSLLLFLCFSVIHPAISCANGEKYILALDDGKGKILFSEKMDNNSEFAIRFIHSVARTPVTDYFIARDGKIILDKTVYHDFGAGLPHNPGKGQKMKAEHGEITITGFNREIPELALRVGRTAEHALLLFKEGKSAHGVKETYALPLASLVKPGSVILFRLLPAH